MKLHNFLILTLFALPMNLAATSALAASAAASPCQGSLDYLDDQYAKNKPLQEAFQAAYEGLKPLPLGYKPMESPSIERQGVEGRSFR